MENEALRELRKLEEYHWHTSNSVACTELRDVCTMPLTFPCVVYKSYVVNATNEAIRTVSGFSFLCYGLPGETCSSIAEGYQNYLEFLLELLPPACSKVLELGSGYGEAACWLASALKCSVVCFERELLYVQRARAIIIARSLATSVRVVHADFLEGVSDLGLFDVCHSAAVINAIATAKLQFYFDCVYKSLSFGGRCILHELLSESSLHGFHSRETVENCMKESGFVIREVYDLSVYWKRYALLLLNWPQLQRETARDTLKRWLNAFEEGRLRWLLFVAVRSPPGSTCTALC